MGHALRAARHPLLRDARRRSGSASASRCCASRCERLGETFTDTREANPGEVWEENEFWIELSWRIDPDGSLGIRQYFESPYRPGEKLTVDEYYGWMFENSVPGLPEKAAAEGLTPLAYMRRYGVFEIAKDRATAQDERPLTAEELDGARRRRARACSRKPTDRPTRRRAARSDEAGAVGVRLDDGVVRRGLLDAVAASWSSTPTTLAPGAGPSTRLPGYIRATSHPEIDAGRGRDGAAADVPAADPDPHPLGATPSGSTRSATPTRCGSTPTTPRGSASAHRRPGAGRDRDRPLRRRVLGHRGHPARRGRAAATTWAAGGCTTTTAAGG